MLKVKLLTPTARPPRRSTDGAAGLDVYADLRGNTVKLRPGESVSIPTGIAVEIPLGLVGFLLGRSGPAFNNTILAHHGTIDPDYRGELKVLLLNADRYRTYPIAPDQRVAQLVVVPFLQKEIDIVSELSGTKRGEDGFGSTGL